MATFISISQMSVGSTTVTESVWLNWEDILVPEKSKLLHYPNPFNPDTWIPYQLANDCSVTISIYNQKGQLIRTLYLGNQKTGIYATKNKAAYWDGRDGLGQKVASGVYFYTLQIREIIPNIGAGDFRVTRMMVIMK